MCFRRYSVRDRTRGACLDLMPPFNLISHHRPKFSSMPLDMVGGRPSSGRLPGLPRQCSDNRYLIAATITSAFDACAHQLRAIMPAMQCSFFSSDFLRLRPNQAALVIAICSCLQPMLDVKTRRITRIIVASFQYTASSSTHVRRGANVANVSTTLRTLSTPGFAVLRCHRLSALLLLSAFNNISLTRYRVSDEANSAWSFCINFLT
ncbi:hypothetical protein BC826DRAFT_739619 [Russula brevipes]|nr:hypothetical protein BC826DRAFT_739619 [Russula brevipes]